jgi:hypothetical protein
MSFMEDLIKKRQVMIDGLKVNEGDINLGIFEDFYPDEAHFIYELLQNAEDAGATKVSFVLKKHTCLFEHNAPHHFDEEDIKAITGIHSSSKKDKTDKIGKFGVGFKSVNVYTDTPIIHSRDYSFKIIKLILPELIEKDPNLNGKTRFEFPFNNPKKKVTEAYSEIESGLRQLSETTLLFLNNIRYIHWSFEGHSGTVLRVDHTDTHIEVLKQIDGKNDINSHWLRFAKPVEKSEKITNAIDGIERQKVAIAFELELKDTAKEFDKSNPISSQMKVKPSLQGNVSVFFPAAKEASGLRFHLHAPFIPELSRASIKNSPDNTPLFEQLAALSASSLHTVRDLGLLTSDFLSALPHNQDRLTERYIVIRDAILNELNSQPLLPTFHGGFAPARSLLHGPVSMKELFSIEDLSTIFPDRVNVNWLSSAGVRGSNLEKLILSTVVNNFDQELLIELLEERLYESKISYLSLHNNVDPAFSTWFASQSAEWLQSFYSILYKFCLNEDDFHDLKNTKIVKLVDGSLSLPSEAYFVFSDLDVNDHLPRVDDQIFSNLGKKNQHEEAKNLLVKLGVKEPGEFEELALMLATRYGHPDVAVSDDLYVADLKRLLALETGRLRQLGEALRSSHFFKTLDNGKECWSQASSIYLDDPYFHTGLDVFYNDLQGPLRKTPCSSWYATIPDIDLNAFGKLTKVSGAVFEFEFLVEEDVCENNPHWNELRRAPGERFTSPINRDYILSPVARKLLNLKRVDAARLIWKTISSSNMKFLKATFRKNETGGAHKAPSRLVIDLAELSWVPLTDGRFVKPCEASLSLMHSGFTVDKSYAWLSHVRFGEKEEKQDSENLAKNEKMKELGFEDEEQLRDAKAFAKLPEHMRKEFLAANSKSAVSKELPEKQIKNPSLRNMRVAEQARNTPQRTSDIRSRAVQVGYQASKDEAKAYLKEQYTNGDQQTFCQICKDVLPFKLLNGVYYFEAVEAVEDSAKRFREGFLCLCPNHAAAYRHINAQKNLMVDLIMQASTNEIEIKLGGELTHIYFTQVHLADLRSCLGADESD